MTSYADLKKCTKKFWGIWELFFNIFSLVWFSYFSYIYALDGWYVFGFIWFYFSIFLSIMGVCIFLYNYFSTKPMTKNDMIVDVLLIIPVVNIFVFVFVMVLCRSIIDFIGFLKKNRMKKHLTWYIVSGDSLPWKYKQPKDDDYTSERIFDISMIPGEYVSDPKCMKIGVYSPDPFTEFQLNITETMENNNGIWYPKTEAN